MAGQNDFKPAATDISAQVMSQAQWESGSERGKGHVFGEIASPTLENKANRQGTSMASALGELIADNDRDAIDDGNITNLKDALKGTFEAIAGEVANEKIPMINTTFTVSTVISATTFEIAADAADMPGKIQVGSSLSIDGKVVTVTAVSNAGTPTTVTIAEAVLLTTDEGQTIYASLIDSIIPDASNSGYGTIRIATDTEAEAGISEATAINPKQLQNFGSGDTYQATSLKVSAIADPGHNAFEVLAPLAAVQAEIPLGTIVKINGKKHKVIGHNVAEDPASTLVTVDDTTLADPDDLGAVVARAVEYVDALPVGSLIWGFGENPFPGTLVCDGAELPRDIYAGLFAAIGTLYGEGDGSTTFGLPDLRDEFIRGNSSSRAVGFKETENQKRQLALSSTVNYEQYSAYGIGRLDFCSAANDPGGNQSGPAYAKNVKAIFSTGVTVQNGTRKTYSGQATIVLQNLAVATDQTILPGWGSHTSEMHPRNIALLPCIKY